MLPSRTLTELEVLYEEEPFGDRAAQTSIAMLAQMFYAVHRGKDQAPTLPLDHFMPGQPAAPKIESREEIANRIKGGMRGAFGRRVHRKRMSHA